MSGRVFRGDAEARGYLEGYGLSETLIAKMVGDARTLLAEASNAKATSRRETKGHRTKAEISRSKRLKRSEGRLLIYAAVADVLSAAAESWRIPMAPPHPLIRDRLSPDHAFYASMRSWRIPMALPDPAFPDLAMRPPPFRDQKSQSKAARAYRALTTPFDGYPPPRVPIVPANVIAAVGVLCGLEETANANDYAKGLASAAMTQARKLGAPPLLVGIAAPHEFRRHVANGNAPLVAPARRSRRKEKEQRTADQARWSEHAAARAADGAKRERYARPDIEKAAAEGDAESKK